MNRGLATSWAIGLGLLAGAIAGTIVPAQSQSQEVRQVAGLSLVFIPLTYAVVTSQWDYWRRTNPYVRFAVYQLTFLVAVVAFVQVAVLAFGSSGLVGQIAWFAAALAAFAVASWMTFYGGADRVWAELVARTDIEW